MEENTTQNQVMVSSGGGINYFDVAQFEHVQRVAKAITTSNLTPDQYNAKKNPESAISNAILALDMASRLGANPLMVMQNLVIVYNKPSWSSTFLVATINSSKKYETLKYRITNTETNLKGMEYTDYVWSQSAGRKVATKKTVDEDIFDVTCVCYTTEKSTGDLLESSEISIRMAILEGWYYKDGSKWRTMAEQMLRYRSASFWQRAYAPEIAMGMMTEDEVIDSVSPTEDAVIIEEKTVPKEEIDSKLGSKTVVINQQTQSENTSKQESPNVQVPKDEKTQATNTTVSSSQSTATKANENQNTVASNTEPRQRRATETTKTTSTSTTPNPQIQSTAEKNTEKAEPTPTVATKKDDGLGGVPSSNSGSAMQANTLFESQQGDDEPDF